MNIKSLAIVVFLAVSCTNWLDVTPDNAISGKDLFSTGFGFRNALNGIYLNMASDELFGKELSWGFMSAISQQYRQDDEIENPIYPDAGKLLYNTIRAEPIVSSIWEKSYKVIANVNKLLEEIEHVPAEKFEYGEDEKQLIVAESLAIRALMHFELFRLFAPAPESSPTGAYLPYRDSYRDNISVKLSVDEFLHRIMSDLDKAEIFLRRFDTITHPSAMYSSGMYDVSPVWSAKYRFSSSLYVDSMGIFFWFRGMRLNYLAIKGLQAMVYLYAGPVYYNLAESSAKELYDTYYKEKHWIGFTAEKDIVGKPDSRYTKMYHDVLFGLYRRQLVENYSSEVWRASSNTTRLPLANIENLFASDNTGVFSDYRLTYLIGKTNETDFKYFTLKYKESTDKDITEIEGPLVPIIRFSEICQILAELSARNGDVSKGIEYLEELRKARGARRSLSLSVKTREQLMEEIVLDIRKESIGEGRTFFTYKRLMFERIPGSDENGDIEAGGKYILPIPVSETM